MNDKKSGRLAPSTTTLRQLYILSGNLCANPKCSTVLLNVNGTVVGEVCHIKAEKPGGPRFDAKMSGEERRAFSNLILLCNVCHKLVDTEVQKYSVRVLARWKAEREAIFAAVGDTLQQRYRKQIEDEVELVDLQIPQNLDGLVGYLNDQNVSHLIDDEAHRSVAEYANRLKNLSMPDRDLLRAIIEKSLKLGGRREGDSGICVHPDDLKTLSVDKRRLSDHRIAKLANTLDRHRLGYLDLDEEPSLRIGAPGDAVRWSEINNYLSENSFSLCDIIVDLKFGLLDGH